MSNVYSNWCPEIYRGIFVDKWNNDKIQLAPCCQATTKVVDSENFNFYTNSYLAQLREEFNNNQKPSACHRCWDDESHNKKSKRLSAIEFYNIEPSTEIILESVDHSSTWACNSACVMCSPNYSSLWATELDMSQDQLYSIGRSMQKKNTVLDMLDLQHIKKIHFNGGEPLLNLEQTTLLKKINIADTIISYNTNGTIYPTQNLIDQWADAKLVKLFFSIDAIGDQFEYIRWPSTWNEVADNLLRMREKLPSNVMFSFNTTVGGYNVLELPELLQWFKKNLSTNREGDVSDFCYQYSFGHDIKFLNFSAKQAIVDALNNIPELAGIVSYTKNNLSYNTDNTWISKLDKIDARRNTNWRKILKIGKYY